jgi:dynein heavy chain
VVLEYLEDRNRYKFRYSIDGTQRGVLVPRIFVCCDLEDPGRYCERMAKAYFSRLYADNLIKFNYYVAKMPTEGLSLIEEAQRTRVKTLTGQPNCDENSFEGLMEEAQADYWRAMNAIILRKHLA